MSDEAAANPARGDHPPTFLFGAGAQKAGTTWLSSYLRTSPQFASGYRKEYHVLDTLDLPFQDWMKKRNIRLAREALNAIAAGEPADADVIHRMSMFADQRYYFDYFTSLLSRSPAVRLTGDLTPDHALLSGQRMRDVRRGFERRGVRTLALLLMRDPVERSWSHMRMQKQRLPDQFPEPAEEMLLRHHRDPAYLERSRYRRTIRPLDRVFGPDVYYGFYERLFDEAEVRRICDFLGIDYVTPNFDDRRNAAPKTSEPEEATLRTVAESYAGTYRFVASRFDIDLPSVWPLSRFVL